MLTTFTTCPCAHLCCDEDAPNPEVRPVADQLPYQPVPVARLVLAAVAVVRGDVELHRDAALYTLGMLLYSRASNEPSRRLKFYNHGEDPCY